MDKWVEAINDEFVELEQALSKRKDIKALDKAIYALVGPVKAGHLQERPTRSRVRIIVMDECPSLSMEMERLWDEKMASDRVKPRGPRVNHDIQLQAAQIVAKAATELQGTTGAKALAVVYVMAQEAVDRGTMTVTLSNREIAKRLGSDIKTVQRNRELWSQYITCNRKGGRTRNVDEETGEVDYKYHSSKYTLRSGGDITYPLDINPWKKGNLTAWRIYLELTVRDATITELSTTLGITRKTVAEALKEMNGVAQKESGHWVCIDSNIRYIIDVVS